MKYLERVVIILVMVFAMSACGDKKDSTERNLEAQKAIQEGMQKEKQMYEGMQKGAENMEKKVPEETKK